MSELFPGLAQCSMSSGEALSLAAEYERETGREDEASLDNLFAWVREVKGEAVLKAFQQRLEFPL